MKNKNIVIGLVLVGILAVSGTLLAGETLKQMFVRELAKNVATEDFKSDVRKSLFLDESSEVQPFSDEIVGAGAHTFTTLQADTKAVTANTTTVVSIQNTDSVRRYIEDIPGCVIEGTNTTNLFGPYVMDVSTSTSPNASSTNPLLVNSGLTTSTLPVAVGASSTFRSQPPQGWQRIWKPLEYLNFHLNQYASSTAGSCTVTYTKMASSS